MLRDLGVSLTAYLASATILVLAIGFGSQGVVQDVVTRLTAILSDLFQVGDLVEISGPTALVQSISMRFTVLLNPYGPRLSSPTGRHPMSSCIRAARSHRALMFS